MNEVTKWFSNKIYNWMDPENFLDMGSMLKVRFQEKRVEEILSHYPNLTLDYMKYHPAGTYQEPEKTILDNIDDFYEIHMSQKVSKNHTGSMRVYLPVHWNQRFMGIAGAGTNTEVDWFSAVRFNVISWPMALKNGYACGVCDNDTGIRLDCSWGFDESGKLEWDHIEAWAFGTIHEMTQCAKEILQELYGQPALASYMHGTSGGAREVMTEALVHPQDYDGLWADAPSIDHVNLAFTCVWAAIVEANEKHIVALAKYKKARELAIADPVLLKVPYDRNQPCWRDYVNHLLGQETEEGPISRRDLQIMVKTWDGPVLCDGRKVAYGFGPTIRQWPLPVGNPMYGYFQRRPDGKYGLMPIAEQYLRWFVEDPNWDVHSCTYEQFTQIYDQCHKKFDRYSFNEDDFNTFARKGGKLIITQGTGDCVVPYQQMMDYYMSAFDHFPSEKMLNDTVRLFMPALAGHSILDWSGPAVCIADGMLALTKWVEEDQAPDVIPTMLYDFAADRVVEASEVSVYNQWKQKQMVKKLQDYR